MLLPLVCRVVAGVLHHQGDAFNELPYGDQSPPSSSLFSPPTNDIPQSITLQDV
ncbi:hypothetical protein SLEP1_g6710 [Rubroshorea leprosula]|uniref:Uncharacterized protein n=1 Tax=Rubroshorea leprosula TaxID=152421 RepID=A0AAV5I599_9ROSI|nr:hypothetical protein SLEP1_g6710 [Rubroshorea leprosula]